MPFADRFVTVQGLRIGYVDQGQGGAVPLVLLHGGGFDHAELTWRLTLEALSTRRRVIVPDLPGYGESEGFDAPQDLRSLGAWVIGFLDALGLDRVDLAGVSMGGGMALWCALEHPARLRRLVPVAPYGIMERLPLHPVATWFAQSGLSRFVYGATARSALVARLGLGATYSDASRVTSQTVAEFQAVARVQGQRRSFDRFLAAELSPAQLPTDFTPRLGEIAMPTLFIHGADDRLIPLRYSRRAVARVPNARLEVMQTGHWPMRERPDLFNAVLSKFLSSPLQDQAAS